MNRENILAVADAIEKHSIPDLGFNMAGFHAEGWEDLSQHNCGTTACIGGYATILLNGGGEYRTIPDGKIADWLGVPIETAEALFYATGVDYGPQWFEKVTPSQAVSVLRHLAETGEVDWDRALAEPSK